MQIEALDVGKIYKIRIFHDGKGIGDGWFLEMVDIKRLTMAMVQIEVKKEETTKKDKKKDKKKKKKEEEEVEIIEELQEVVETFTFACSRWLARDEEDGEIVVELLTDSNEELESKWSMTVICTLTNMSPLTGSILISHCMHYYNATEDLLCFPFSELL